MGRPEAWKELEEAYGDLERELSVLRPLCQRSSKCCRFQEYGHQLWTTSVELDYLVEHEGLPSAPASASGSSPYLKDGLCGVRDHRMLGCRIYFCDPNYKSAMEPLYEKYHARIKEIHRRHGQPYEYVEFLKALDRRIETKL